MSAALETRLVTEPYVLSSPADLAATLRARPADFQATTALIAAIALFAGAFLIFNTLSMTVAERIREVGLLRAAGASRGQVMSFMLTQALALGVVGSLVGLALGVLLAVVMVAFVGTIGSVTLDRPAVPPDALAIAFLVGVAVTLAAALEPARRASRIQPVEALRARLDAPGARPPGCAGWRSSSSSSRSSGCSSSRARSATPASIEALLGLRGPARRHAADPVPAARHGP